MRHILAVILGFILGLTVATIFFLLMNTPLFGQDGEDTEYSIWDYTAPKVEKGLLPVFFSGYEKEFRLITFETVLAYEEECYNDSTLIDSHDVGVGGSHTGFDGCYGFSTGYNFSCENPSHSDTTKWIHRDITFKGFIEFLKQEIK